MDLTVLKIILLAGALQGVILGLLLFSRQANQAANRVFAVLLWLLSIHLALVGFDNRSFMMRFPHFSHLTWVLPALYGPLALVFLRRMTQLAPRPSWREGLYFIPFLIVLGLQLPYLLQSAAAKRAYLDDYASSVQDDFGLSNQLVNFIHLFFFGWCILVYRAHEKRIRDFYSDLSKVRLDWLGQFLYIAFAIVVLSIFVFYARKFDWPFLSAFYPWHFLGVVAVIYWTAYRALAQPMLFTGEEASAASAGLSDAIFLFPEESAEQKKAPDDPQRKALAEKLVQIMELERLYLNSELTVQDLVNRLQANRQYISEALNLHLGKTFYDFVNDYRVEAFQRLAKDPAHGHYTILGLALEAGFNSKATFNAIFKKKVGMTPSEYIRRIKMSLN